MDQKEEVEPTYYPLPMHSVSQFTPWAFWDGGFTFEELEKLTAYGDSLEPAKAVVTGQMEEAQLKATRDSSVSWIRLNSDTKWLYDRLRFIVMKLNNQWFGFDLYGVHDLQYTVYNSAHQHYDWHVDCHTPCDDMQRKLSLTIQLSDPFDYEGGELQLHGGTREVLPKKRGIVHAFPSFTPHRVTPVTAGVRKSLVAWIVGPQWR